MYVTFLPRASRCILPSSLRDASSAAFRQSPSGYTVSSSPSAVSGAETDARGFRNALPRLLEGAVLGQVANHETPRDAHNISDTPYLSPRGAYDAPSGFSRARSCNARPVVRCRSLGELLSRREKRQTLQRSSVFRITNRLSPHRTCAYSSTGTRRIERRTCRPT